MNGNEPTAAPARRRGRKRNRVSKPLAFPEEYQIAIKLFLAYNEEEAQAGLDAARATMKRIGRNPQSLGQIDHYGRLVKYLQYLEGRVPQKWYRIREIDGEIDFGFKGETPK